MLEIFREKFIVGVAAFQAGRFAEAERALGNVLQRYPRHFDTLHLLGIIAYETGRPEQGVKFFKKAIRVNARVADAHYNLANTLLLALNHPQDALISYNCAIELKPNFSEAYNNRGIALKNLGHISEALASYDKAIALKSDYAEAYNNRGNALLDLKRPAEALTNFDKAISLRPAYVEAYSNRSNALVALERFSEAIESCDKAIAIDRNYAEAYINRAGALRDLKRFEEAQLSYDKAAALKSETSTFLKTFEQADRPQAVKNYNVWLERGNTFFELQRYDEALAAYDKALALRPDLEGTWLGRGNIFCKTKRYDEALVAYDRAIELKPDLAGAWLGRGNAFYDLKRYDEAFAAYDKALALKPDFIGAEGARLRSKMNLCNWANFSTDCDHLTESIRSNKENAEPFDFCGINSSAEEQFNCAKLWVQKHYPPAIKPFWAGELYKHDKIRIGYVSADFRQHPVAYLLAGVFECHNKSQFDVVAISIGPKDNSELRQRLERSFDKFIDANALSADEIATQIKNAEIDILIDLNGFTQNSRTEVFARRPAPIQVNYLGYPGTMGAEYINYIIADQTVIPETQKHLYMEKIIYLPNSFQPTDRERRISDKTFMRAEVGLPQEGFVFCNFNTHYKITPDVFDIWMRILKQVNGSVLWLVAGGPTIEDNLKKEALVRGVNAERLIFAPLISLPEHQARLRLADLFLDTLPYNAGATASDTLWAGIPLLTCIGDTFVGRMAASVLKAISLPELITTTPEGYEHMAADLAMHPEKLAAIRHKLAENRLTTPLFDTRLYTKHIEAAYIAMHERHQAGLAPNHIVVLNQAKIREGDVRDN